MGNTQFRRACQVKFFIYVPLKGANRESRGSRISLYRKGKGMREPIFKPQTSFLYIGRVLDPDGRDPDKARVSRKFLFDVTLRGASRDFRVKFCIRATLEKGTREPEYSYLSDFYIFSVVYPDG